MGPAAASPPPSEMYLLLTEGCMGTEARGSRGAGADAAEAVMSGPAVQCGSARVGFEVQKSGVSKCTNSD